MKKISIIIPCHNSEKYLKDCFFSLTNQTIKSNDLEIIFINDASTDSTEKILSEYEKLYPDNIIVVSLDKNVKQGGARNIGLQYATGEYISFLDSDDWVSNDFYETLYNKAKKYNADIVCFPFNNIKLDDSNNIISLKISSVPKKYGFFSIENIQDRKKFLEEKVVTCGSQNKLYRRSLIEAVSSRFVEGVAYEEPSFVYKLFFYANRFYCFKESGYFYRQHTNSTMSSYVHQRGKLYDHPYVQLIVYLDMKRRKEIYNTYKAEIDYYFLFSFYIETLYFAKEGNLYLGEDFIRTMNEAVTTYLPEWHSNIYLQKPENAQCMKIMESIN